MFILSIIASMELVRILVVNMRKTPIVFYVDDVPVPLTKINFPAVTFCPGLVIKNDDEILIDYTKITNDLESGEIDLNNLTQSEYE